MATFAADGALAAMSQRAHSILAGKNLAASSGGDRVIPRPAPNPSAPTEMYQQMVQKAAGSRASALAGITGNSQSVIARLKSTSIAPANVALAIAKAQAFAAKKAAADAAAQDAAYARIASFGGTPGGLENPDQWANNAGLSGEQITQATQNMATQRGWTPHMVMKEGSRFNRDGSPNPNGDYLSVKYMTPEGWSTELTYAPR